MAHKISHLHYLLGKNGIENLAESKVLVVGIGHVGLEIAKNLLLMGIGHLTLHDCQTLGHNDVNENRFLNDEDVGKNRYIAARPEHTAEVAVQILKDMNPSCHINIHDTTCSDDSDWRCVEEFDCVVVTDLTMKSCLQINNACRNADRFIPFVMCNIFGSTAWHFTDFGNAFVCDTNAEQMLIIHIDNSNPGTVTCSSDHGLSSGDIVCIYNVKGMEVLNGTAHQITVTSASSFSIGDTTHCGQYHEGGIYCVRRKFAFENLQSQLRYPKFVTWCNQTLEDMLSNHLGLSTINSFYDKETRMPFTYDTEQLTHMIQETALLLDIPPESLNIEKVLSVVLNSQNSFLPLVMWSGGLASFEVVKAITKQFIPVQQWLNVSLPEISSDLSTLKLLIIGCSSIACEVLLSLPKMGCATSGNGKITIVDTEIVRHENLASQSLFRDKHVGQLKTEVIAGCMRSRNPSIKVERLSMHFNPQVSSNSIGDLLDYHDVVICAVDSYESRRYVSRMCVEYSKPLIHCGTVGFQGNVEVIVPFKSQQYNGLFDMLEKDIPYCTLKSFPATDEHIIVWAKLKYDNLFSVKPDSYNKFWMKQEFLQETAAKLQEGTLFVDNDTVLGVKLLEWISNGDWASCVYLARLKFEKYFNHKAKHLLYCFPSDLKTESGSLFWDHPKHIPTPVMFDMKNSLHSDFIYSFALLWAAVCSISVPADWRSQIQDILNNFKVPECVAHSNKHVETNEQAEKPVKESSVDNLHINILEWINSHSSISKAPKLLPNVPSRALEDTAFRFLIAAANLRAHMYGLPSVSDVDVKKIATKLSPTSVAGATCTAGLVLNELLKCASDCPLEAFSNVCFNLGTTSYVRFQPLAAVKTHIGTAIEFTVWDKWQVQGNDTFRLSDFLKYVKKTYGADASMVVQGTKLIYSPMLYPQHKSRKKQKMKDLLVGDGTSRTHAVLTLTVEQEDDECVTPPVTYYF